MKKRRAHEKKRTWGWGEKRRVYYGRITYSGKTHTHMLCVHYTHTHTHMYATHCITFVLSTLHTHIFMRTHWPFFLFFKVLYAQHYEHTTLVLILYSEVLCTLSFSCCNVDYTYVCSFSHYICSLHIFPLSFVLLLSMHSLSLAPACATVYSRSRHFT